MERSVESTAGNRTEWGGAGWLSCYTANLLGYLEAEWDGVELIATSIRLAMRRESGAGSFVFSHHHPPLSSLPDGTRMAYGASCESREARDEIETELRLWGRALVVCDSASLPWSGSLVASGPHWVLVDGEADEVWHVVDGFAAVPGEGAHATIREWIDVSAFINAIELRDRWTPHQEMRNAMAFGNQVHVPDGQYRWIRRRDDLHVATEVGKASDWIDDDATILATVVERIDSGQTDLLDDLWAAAGHRCFAYAWRLRRGTPYAHALRSALESWRRLPVLLRLASESQRRGRPRRSLAESAIADTLGAEALLARSS